MMNSGQNLDEAFCDYVQLSKGNIRLVQLTVVANSGDNHVDHVAELGRGGSFYGTSSSLDRVRDHDYGSLFSLGFRAGVPELLLQCGRVRIVSRLARLVIKELHESGSVMLRYDRDNPGRQFIGPGKLYALLDVVGKHQGRHEWTQSVMAIAHVGLVLDEVGGANHLSYVVIITSYAGEQGVGSYGLSGSFGEEPHHNRMMIGAGGALSQLPEQRQIEVRELEEFDVSRYAERPFENGQQNRRNHGGQQTADKPAEGIKDQHGERGLVGSQEVEGQSTGGVYDSDPHTGPDERGPVAAALQVIDSSGARNQGVGRQVYVVGEDAYKNGQDGGQHKGGLRISKQGDKQSPDGEGSEIVVRKRRLEHLGARPLGNNGCESEHETGKAERDRNGGNHQKEMAADPQVPMLIPKQVLPEHHQQQQYDDQHTGKFYGSFAEPEPAGRLFEQSRLYRCNRLAVDNNGFPFFDGYNDGIDVSFGGVAADIAFGFVVREVGQEERAEDFAELAALAGAIFRGPSELLGAKGGAGSNQIADGREVADALFLAVFLIAANEPGRSELVDLGAAADHTTHHGVFEMCGHQAFELGVEFMPD